MEAIKESVLCAAHRENGNAEWAAAWHVGHQSKWRLKMGFKDKFKSVEEALKKNSGSFGNYLKTALSTEMIDALSKGSLFIPGKMLDGCLRQAVEDQKGVSIERTEFSNKGILIDLSITKGAIDILCPITLIAESFQIAAEKQELSLNVETGRLEGKSMAGRIAVFLAAGLINKIIASKIEASSLAASKEEKSGNHLIRIDLSGTSLVQKLTRQIPAINKSALDFFDIDGIDHVENGLVIKVNKK